MECKMAYLNYKQFAVIYDCTTHTFSYWHTPNGKILENGCLAGGYNCTTGEKVLDVRDYEEFSVRNVHSMDGEELQIQFRKGPEVMERMTLYFIATDAGVECRLNSRGDLDYRFRADLLWGDDMEHDTFAMALGRRGVDLRSAIGPAASSIDNVLFNRREDKAMIFSRYRALRLSFDWNKHGYCMEARTCALNGARGFAVGIKQDVYRQMFNIPYKPINKNNTFPKPPCGWMTWYAVMFDASEKTVLENAQFQKDYLADYGANAIWVDWEWYHGMLYGKWPEGIHSFSPDPVRYPNGMSYVAEKIKELGFVPAIWIAATNEPVKNADMEANPDMIAVQDTCWCGEYFFDLSNPKYYNDYVPRLFGQLKDWGYQALKWDTLPITLELADKYHGCWMDPTVTTEEAYRRVIAKARDAVGEDFYMISCSGFTVRDITMALDYFDAARIGDDIFEWSEFLKQCCGRVMKFYQYHNVVHYNDADNVVLREEFNTLDQAISRVSFVSLLGLPITFGDDLTKLPAERLELLRRALPAVDAHPMDIRETLFDQNLVITNLSVCKPFGSWNVVNVFNPREEAQEYRLDLTSDLHLDEGSYHVYEYWTQTYCGVYSETMVLSLPSYASKVLAFHKVAEEPQVISTSRHITQGGFDLQEVVWEKEEQILRGVSSMVKGEAYKMVIAVPEGFVPADDKMQEIQPGIWRVSFMPEETGEESWEICFE